VANVTFERTLFTRLWNYAAVVVTLLCYNLRRPLRGFKRKGCISPPERQPSTPDISKTKQLHISKTETLSLASPALTPTGSHVRLPSVHVAPLLQRHHQQQATSGSIQLANVFIISSTDSVRERTIPAERPPLVGEVSAKRLRIEGATWSS
jgi:hypothetical protein